MVGRIILTVLVLVACFFIIQVVEQKIAPSHASQLAVDSVNDPAAMEQLRIEQNAQNWLDPIVYICAIGLLYWIWSKPIKKLYELAKSPPPSINS